jgi:hypothetical protein
MSLSRAPQRTCEISQGTIRRLVVVSGLFHALVFSGAVLGRVGARRGAGFELYGPRTGRLPNALPSAVG